MYKKESDYYGGMKVIHQYLKRDEVNLGDSFNMIGFKSG